MSFFLCSIRLQVIRNSAFHWFAPKQPIPGMRFAAQTTSKLTSGRQLDSRRKERYVASKELREVNNRICNAVKRGDVDTALQAYEQMRANKRPRPDMTTFHFLLTGCARLGRVQRTHKIFNDMKKFGFKVDERVLTALANVAAEAKSDAAADHALEIVKASKGNTNAVTVVVLNALMKAFARNGNAERAREIFDMIAGNSLRPGNISYSTLMTAYITAEQPAEAFAVLDQMAQQRLRPDSQTYGTLLRAVRALDDPKLAFELTNDMRAKDVPITAQTVTLVLECCIAYPALRERCVQLYDGCEHKDLVLHNTMLRALARWGANEQAFRLFDSLKANRVQPDEGTYIAVLMACGNDSTKAFRVFDELVAAGVRPTAQIMNALLTAAGKNADAAFRIVELMREHNVKANDVVMRTMSASLVASRKAVSNRSE